MVHRVIGSEGSLLVNGGQSSHCGIADVRARLALAAFMFVNRCQRSALAHSI